MSTSPIRPRVRFTEADHGDLPGLQALAERIWRASYPGILPESQIDYMLAWMYGRERLEHDLAEGVTYLKVLLEDDWIGFAGFGPGEEAPGLWWLHKLYLLREHQGCGLGGHVLAEVLRRVAAAGGQRLRLRVNRFNPRAFQAYRKAGFVTVGEVRTEIGGGFVMDDHVMERPAGPVPD